MSTADAQSTRESTSVTDRAQKQKKAAATSGRRAKGTRSFGYLPSKGGTRRGSCGDFNYWKDGQCVSARDKRPENEPIYKFY